MNTYTIYKTETGEIVSIYSGNNISANLPSDCSYILGDYDQRNYKVVDGVVTAKSQAEMDVIIDEENWGKLRDIRNDMLQRTDWTQSPDSPLTDAKKQEWAVYRQQLRDMPSTADPENPTWPSQPT